MGEVCKPSCIETLEKFSHLCKTLSRRIYHKWPKKKFEIGDAASTNSAYCRSIEETFNTRGGVEDTRLEAKAKAKDTKKIRGQGQGQGQPFRGQTLSRPRTGMLEAKAKDQGHKAQVLSKKKKKKGLHKNFSGDLQKKKKKKRSSQKFFKRSPRKNAFQKIFQPLHKILTFQKIVLSSSRGQANFRGLEASRPRPRPRT